MKIIDWEFGQDLRDINHAEAAINRMTEKYTLQDGQAVVFFNNSRWCGGSGYHPPKARLYFRYRGRTVLICPAVRRRGDQVDFMLDFALWLRDNVQGAKQIVGLTDVITEMEARQPA